MNKKEARVRRARKTRVRIAEQQATRLTVGRSNSHIYAQIIAPTGDKVLASASTLEADVRKEMKNGGNKAAATFVGKRIAEGERLRDTTRASLILLLDLLETPHEDTGETVLAPALALTFGFREPDAGSEYGPEDPVDWVVVRPLTS